jgi:hypothetical protein
MPPPTSCHQTQPAPNGSSQEPNTTSTPNIRISSTATAPKYETAPAVANRTTGLPPPAIPVATPARNNATRDEQTVHAPHPSPGPTTSRAQKVPVTSSVPDPTTVPIVLLSMLIISLHSKPQVGHGRASPRSPPVHFRHCSRPQFPSQRVPAAVNIRFHFRQRHPSRSAISS